MTKRREYLLRQIEKDKQKIEELSKELTDFMLEEADLFRKELAEKYSCEVKDIEERINQEHEEYLKIKENTLDAEDEKELSTKEKKSTEDEDEEAVF